MNVWIIELDEPWIDNTTRIAKTREKAYEIAKEMTKKVIKKSGYSDTFLASLEDCYRATENGNFYNAFLYAEKITVEE